MKRLIDLMMILLLFTLTAHATVFKTPHGGVPMVGVGGTDVAPVNMLAGMTSSGVISPLQLNSDGSFLFAGGGGGSPTFTVNKQPNGGNPTVNVGGTDTAPLNIISGLDVSGNIVPLLLNADGSIPSGGGGGAAWGAITGSISAQTDLQSALNAKVSNVDNTFSVKSSADATKLLGLDLSGQTTATNFVLAPQNTSNMTLHIPQVATASGAGMALVQDETTGFIFGSGITSSIGAANSMMQLANATVANRAQIKLHSYFNGASVAGVSTLTSKSGVIGTNAAIGTAQDYSKWTAQAAATTPGSAPISGAFAFKSAATINALTVPSDFHIQLTNLAGTLADRFYLTSEGLLKLPGYAAGLLSSDSSGNITNISPFASGSIPFSNGTSLVEDNTDLFFDTVNKSMLVGPGPHPATSATLAVTSQVSDTKTVLSVYSKSTNNAFQISNENAFSMAALTASNTNSPSINFERARGVLTAKTQVLAGDILGSFVFNGYTGSADGSFAAAFGSIATENQAAGHAGANIIFQTAANGTTTLVPRLVIDQDGAIVPYFSASNSVGRNNLKFKDAHFSDVLQIGVRGAGSTPTCAAADNGTLALTSGYILCVCNGSSWVQPTTGLAACTF